MTTEERVQWTLRLWERVVANDSTTSRDFVETLIESEVACLRENVGDELYEQHP